MYGNLLVYPLSLLASETSTLKYNCQCKLLLREKTKEKYTFHHIWPTNTHKKVTLLVYFIFFAKILFAQSIPLPTTVLPLQFAKSAILWNPVIFLVMNPMVIIITIMTINIKVINIISNKVITITSIKVINIITIIIIILIGQDTRCSAGDDQVFTCWRRGTNWAN